MKTKLQFSKTALKYELNHQTLSSIQSALFTTKFFSRIFQSELDSTSDDKTTENMYENSKCHKNTFLPQCTFSPNINSFDSKITKHTGDYLFSKELFSAPSHCLSKFKITC